MRGDIQSRSLVVAIPGFPSASQWDAMAQAVQAGAVARNSVVVQCVVMPDEAARVKGTDDNDAGRSVKDRSTLLLGRGAAARRLRPSY
jgi:hypothetical protein